jgi:hypothetical protein
MKVGTHVLLQALGFAISFGTMATNIVPPKAQPYIVLIVSASQGLLGWINHYYTPSGTAIPS